MTSGVVAESLIDDIVSIVLFMEVKGFESTSTRRTHLTSVSSWL